jgi:hypothetical protein
MLPSHTPAAMMRPEKHAEEGGTTELFTYFVSPDPGFDNYSLDR